MPFLLTHIDEKTVKLFPPVESWLVNSNFPRASRMQSGVCTISNFQQKQGLREDYFILLYKHQ